jgi:hypothetical protein
MKTLEISLDFGSHVMCDKIPEDQLDEVLAECQRDGIGVKVLREVPWTEQLATMENNPEAI